MYLSATTAVASFSTWHHCPEQSRHLHPRSLIPHIHRTFFVLALSSYASCSEKSDSIRTVQGFSTEAAGKLTGEKYFDIWANYWGAEDYADQFTGSACQGTGDFSTASALTRSEACLKGAQ